ncbi:MAG: sortase [Clostridia bacterium]|nr:sortase [Clostridia bacterium]
MKRCIFCLNECPDDTAVCPSCGFGGSHAEKNPDNCLPVGTRLNNRYIVGGVSSKGKVFTSYYALDVRNKQRVKISEYLHEKLIYRLPGEMIIKYNNETCAAKGDKEIAAYYAHYLKLCAVSKTSVLDFIDCFAENSTFYYACAINNGTPLSSSIGNGKTMTFSRAVSLLSPIIDCAKKLASAGKWHGSISPYTIIMSDEKITALTGYSYPPKTISTPFDAPEKQFGAKHCGSFTDVYAIGAILYEAVTGFLPPSAAERNKGKALRFPESIGTREKTIIEKALALDKDERYSSADELISDIGGKLTDKPKNHAVNNDIKRKIVLITAIIVLIAGAAVLINYYIIEPFKEDKQSESLAELVSQVTTTPMVDPWIEIKNKYPDVEFPDGMNPAFSDLYAINSDFAGWISIPEMNINYSVVQAEDNDKYLRRDIYGKYTNYGVPFFDYRCGLRQLSRNTVLYGHNMRHDDKIFGTLERYREIEGFKKAPLIGMSTLYGDYTFKIYAVFISNSKESDDNGKIFNYIFVNAGNERFKNYITEIDKRKLYSTGVDINENDKIITLSTCCYDFEDARLVVVGRLLRDGENPEVDMSLAKENPVPKFPQAYYDAKRMENPYENDIILFE